MVLLAARIRHLVPPADQALVGDFISPRAWKQVGDTPIWAADNDAFSGFNPDRYRRMLDVILDGVSERGGLRPPVFVTVPDVVGDHSSTRELYEQWQREVSDRALPRAFVLQNGIEDEVERHGWRAIEWDEVEALFIGGDNAFKFSEHVRYLVDMAKALGKWVHMGRVNSVRRMEYARRIGCDSCDGSGMARFPSSVLIPMIHCLKQDQQFLAI